MIKSLRKLFVSSSHNRNQRKCLVQKNWFKAKDNSQWYKNKNKLKTKFYIVNLLK